MDVFLINEKIESLSQNLKEIKESLWLRQFKKKIRWIATRNIETRLLGWQR